MTPHRRTFGSSDSDNRAEWNRAWASMPHRRLISPGFGIGRDLISRFGNPISGTISQDPPPFAEGVWRESELCPICGNSTTGADRTAATIHRTWANGFRVGIGVWAHRACFEGCPVAGGPAPKPW
jgi:hypothetical protein